MMKNLANLSRFQTRFCAFAVSIFAIAGGFLAPAVYGALSGTSLQPVKTERTYYTDERVDRIRPGLASSVNRADSYLEENSLDDLWRFVPGQALPRSFAIHTRESSHVHSSPERWKVEVEIDGEERLMPSNDFGAYYESGLDSRGWFDPELADRSLLVNELYPEKPMDWGVDDGWGWKADDGTHWTFIAHYLHWHGFIGVRNRIVHFRNAYLYTGDKKYARAGLVLLDRLADIYPELDVGEHDLELYKNSNGGVGTGKMIGRFWEANRIRNIMSGYDAFFPLIQEGDQVLVDFLSGKAAKYGLENRKESTGAIARNIEDKIFREILPAVKNVQVRGDYGNLGALAMAAVVLDEPDGYTGKVMEFIMRNGDVEHVDGEWRTTGGGVLPYLVNQVDRDGFADRGAPQYDRIFAGRLGRAADILEGYAGAGDLNLADHPKYRLLRVSNRKLSMLDRYVPNIGDTESTGKPTRNAYSPSPAESANLAGHGFAALREGEREPGNWPDNRRAAWLHYGRNAIRDADGNRIAGGHAHRNALMLGLYGFGLDLAPDLGYPEQTGSWPKRIHWTANTISHNTVMVDRDKQEGHWVGISHHFEESEFVRFVDVEAPIVYPQTEMYRRTTAMIRVDDANSYLVDFFRVSGGDDHLFGFHAAEGPVEAEGLTLREQPRGTYAGEDVRLPGRGEEMSYNDEFPDGFNYLYDVRRAPQPAGGFSVEWQIEDSWDVLPGDVKEGIRVRLTMLNEDLDELALAHGDPPQRTGANNPRRLNYLLARREGSELETTFTSVIEPYRQERLIREIESLDVHDPDGNAVHDIEARAMRVTLNNGNVDTIVQSVHPDRRYVIDGDLAFQGTIGLRREDANGRPERAYLHGGPILQRGPGDPAAIHREPGWLSGRVIDFTREMATENSILFELREAEQYVDELAGRWIYVETDGWRNGAYEIQDAAVVSPDRVELDIGTATLIREFVDSEDFSKGYRYNIAEGASAKIPLSKEVDL